MQKELVHIWMVTYNHEPFIAHAIESVLMQKTNFNYRLIIGEDCSTDGTREIVKEYANKYPERITAYLNNVNLGPNKNAQQIYEACTAKYMAMLEGDDYWIDPLKLQKQVDFMENNLEYAGCFHNALIMYDDQSHPPKILNRLSQKNTLILPDLVNKWNIATASFLVRRNNLEIPSWFDHVYNGDFVIGLLVADKGPIGYLPGIMSVYRKQSTGFSYNPSITEEFINNKLICTLELLNDHLNIKYNEIITEKINVLRKRQKKIRLLKKLPFLKILEMKRNIKQILFRMNLNYSSRT